MLPYGWMTSFLKFHILSSVPPPFYIAINCYHQVQISRTKDGTPQCYLNFIGVFRMMRGLPRHDLPLYQFQFCSTKLFIFFHSVMHGGLTDIPWAFLHINLVLSNWRYSQNLCSIFAGVSAFNECDTDLDTVYMLDPSCYIWVWQGLLLRKKVRASEEQPCALCSAIDLSIAKLKCCLFYFIFNYFYWILEQPPRKINESTLVCVPKILLIFPLL